jgi:DNA-binding MarR family transcriptional regulator
MTTDHPSDPSDVLELAARLRLATARLARQLRQQAGDGLSPSQQSALVSIDKHGPLTLGRLAKIEQVTPPTVTKAVARREEDGLVERTIDAADRRIARVTITDAGRGRLEHSRSRRNAWLAQRLRTVDPEGLRRIEAAVPLLEELAAAPDDTSATAGDRGRVSDAPTDGPPAGEEDGTSVPESIR